MKLAVVGETSSWEGAESFADTTTFLATPLVFDAIVVTLKNASLRAVADIRADDRYRLCLLYLQVPAGPTAAALSDGQAPDSQAQLMAAYRTWRERLALFNRGRPPQGPDARILAYLWLRAPGRLQAIRDPGLAQHYGYPLLDVLAGTAINAAVWLQNQQQAGLLDSVALIDRIRLCATCGTGHLNYVDVCVECHSLDIHRKPSLHCFTCGHVGHQERFLKDGVLVCPNCLTRLRHIGVDYDRPLENYSCGQCGAFFTDAEVEARCLDHGHRQSPDRLSIREIRDYQLSESGLLACRQGLQPSNEDYFGRLAMVGATAFKELLDWQIELIRRHQAPTFALVGVRFHNLARTLARIGEARGHALLDTLVERIREAIRDTDRSTRTREETLWLLLMHTGEQGVQRVGERLERIGNLFVGQDLQEIEIRTVACLAPRDLLADESAELLLARLSGEL